MDVQSQSPVFSWRKLTYSLLAAGLFLSVLGVANSICSRTELPQYSTWTGNRPLEDKLEMLEEFTADRDVDALLFGSSIVDFGVSAEHLSELMSRELGREYRAFNFSTGAAELRTIPKLYRMARTVTKPKDVFVFTPPQARDSESFSERGPDNGLSQSPVSDAVNFQVLMDVSKAFWRTPLMRDAPALRDQWIYGQTFPEKLGHSQAYPVNRSGDRVSYCVQWDQDPLRNHMETTVISVKPYPPNGDQQAASRANLLRHHFASVDLSAIRQLRRMVEHDGGRIVLVSHAAAALFAHDTTWHPDYTQARREYFDLLSNEANAVFLDVAEELKVPPYAISDYVHLNSHGARAFTRAVCRQLLKTDGIEVEPEIESPAIDPALVADLTFNGFTAMVRRPAGGACPLVRFRMVTNSRAVAPLPEMELSLALRTDDETDIVVPAVKIGAGDYVAEVNLPESDHPRMMFLRLLCAASGQNVALNHPVVDYEWLDTYPRIPLPTSDESQSPVFAWPSDQCIGESVYVAVNPRTTVPVDAVYQLESLSESQTAPIDLATVPAGTKGLRRFVLPSDLSAGQYRVRVESPVDGKLLATSAAMKVREIPRIEVLSDDTIGAAEIEVVWSGIDQPTTEDWIGVFPTDDAAGRLDFRFLNGDASGGIRFDPGALAAVAGNADLECRLYAAGTWRLLAKSNPFRVSTASAVAQVPVEAVEAQTAELEIVTGGTGASSHGIEVAWRGIGRPSPRDWIGVFKVGDNDERLDFKFLDGKPEGSSRFAAVPLAALVGDAQLEFRLYSNGSWRLLARSNRFQASAAVTASHESAVGDRSRSAIQPAAASQAQSATLETNSEITR